MMARNKKRKIDNFKEIWQAKYIPVQDKKVWERCPMCQRPHDGSLQPCKKCKHPMPMFQPLDKNGQPLVDCMMIDVYGCKQCSSTDKLNWVQICQQCYEKMSYSEKKDTDLIFLFNGPKQYVNTQTFQKFEYDLQDKQQENTQIKVQKTTQKQKIQLNSQKKQQKKSLGWQNLKEGVDFNYESDDDYGQYPDNDYDDYDDYMEEPDYDDDQEQMFTPHSGFYMTGTGDRVYQSVGEQQDFTACGSDCGWCGRCGY